MEEIIIPGLYKLVLHNRSDPYELISQCNRAGTALQNRHYARFAHWEPNLGDHAMEAGKNMTICGRTLRFNKFNFVFFVCLFWSTYTANTR